MLGQKHIHVYIGKAIRSADTAANEPLPKAMQDLLDQLQEKEGFGHDPRQASSQQDLRSKTA